jgi:hypothetical protein
MCGGEVDGDVIIGELCRELKGDVLFELLGLLMVENSLLCIDVILSFLIQGPKNS